MITRTASPALRGLLKDALGSMLLRRTKFVYVLTTDDEPDPPPKLPHERFRLVINVRPSRLARDAAAARAYAEGRAEPRPTEPRC
ncbi:MAG: hypothetical protein U1E45_16510 [Geminicoccaceae bacterium]